MLLLVGGGVVGEWGKASRGNKAPQRGQDHSQVSTTEGWWWCVACGPLLASNETGQTNKSTHAASLKSSSSLFCVSDDEAAHIKIGTKMGGDSVSFVWLCLFVMPFFSDEWKALFLINKKWRARRERSVHKAAAAAAAKPASLPPLAMPPSSFFSSQHILPFTGQPARPTQCMHALSFPLPSPPTPAPSATACWSTPFQLRSIRRRWPPASKPPHPATPFPLPTAHSTQHKPQAKTMRVWSLHPIYLDQQGLCGLWRETLLIPSAPYSTNQNPRQHHARLVSSSDVPGPARALWPLVRDASLPKSIGRGHQR